MSLEQLLEKTYGFDSFRPGQKEVITAVMDGRNVLALLPTGMGKSMCYQLPGHMLPGSVLIVSPLLSLMLDQVSQLKKMGEKSVVALNSFLKPEEKEAVLRKAGDYKFIFVSPEMLAQPFVISRLKRIRISLLVADEAHCISQWGFDFRPDYLRISEVMAELGSPQVLALTATATKKVQQDILHYLSLEEPNIYVHPMDRRNIAYDVKRFDTREGKLEWLKDFTAHYAGRGIVYAGTRKKAEELSAVLRQNGVRAVFYHGGMEQLDRVFIQQQFQNGETDWVCSTSAFGMGVHVPDIRHVIHFQIPTSIEEFVQEVGRAGRDGQPSLSTLLVSPGDEALMNALLADELPTRFEAEAVLNSGGDRALVSDGVVRETSFRVLKYWLSRMPLDKTMQRMENLLQEKMNRAARMSGFPASDGCLRSYIAETFDQEITDRPSNCCVNCGLDYSMYPVRKEGEQHSGSGGWQERLGRILP
ncbi:RecQ family ATP-dependent DNA helicase [Indiicoccus explosivorum]|uniref:RecQ family ATP-dependent DNA helicase n=1 Tax=Indiicoccus explosivorum TaxID=1917864 RepID=UPI000B42DE4D|nr:ATP-dependent DNA helicase RecQ [Indiicoccus explosivorum]